ncbi:circadian clock-controlled protein daywake [Microplitis demolitor]|uniref:circadian clock-controlled protein daywake n=1 Tax=Microplitis demolitor TaxID=69319 RepID=UPI0004CCE445|nr:circadian clock-controlled protein daywake [Microplitis demolitor]
MSGFKIIFLAVLISCASAIDLPEFLRVCNRNDPNMNACIKDSAEHLKPYLITGVPEYKIPSLEPLLLNDLVAAEGHGIRITGKDVKAYGAGNYFVKEINVDMATLEFNVDILLPHLYVEGIYEIDGKVLLLPITGSGRMIGNFTDCIGSVKFFASAKPDAQGVKQFNIDEFNLKVTVGNGNLQLDNLFGGDKTIGDVVNQAINANFAIFLREILPLVEKSLAIAFRDIGNGIVNSFTFDQLFPM